MKKTINLIDKIMNEWKTNKFDNYSLFLCDLQQIKNQILKESSLQENTKPSQEGSSI